MQDYLAKSGTVGKYVGVYFQYPIRAKVRPRELAIFTIPLYWHIDHDTVSLLEGLWL